MKHQLQHYISHNILKQPDFSFSDDQPLISSGLIDSFRLVELSVFIETEFNVKIPDHLITPEHFDTMNLIIQTIVRVQGNM
jgi:acyl carrier protein